MSMNLCPDILQLIAQEIRDPDTWLSFSLCCKKTANITKMIGQEKKKELQNIDFLYSKTLKPKYFLCVERRPIKEGSIWLHTEIYKNYLGGVFQRVEYNRDRIICKSYYSQTGRLHRYTEYTRDLQNIPKLILTGPFTEYSIYESWETFVEGQYSNGEKVGTWKYYKGSPLVFWFAQNYDEKGNYIGKGYESV